jgi:hypothetical protein
LCLVRVQVGWKHGRGASVGIVAIASRVSGWG